MLIKITGAITWKSYIKQADFKFQEFTCTVKNVHRRQNEYISESKDQTDRRLTRKQKKFIARCQD